MIIEPLSSGAACPLARLHRACFPEEAWDAEVIEQIIRMPGFFGRIGWAKNTPIGFALALAAGGEAEILSLGVFPGRRRRGFGSAILDAMCDEARLRNAEQIFLEVASDNEPAVVLYARRGFIVVGHRPNYYRRAEGSSDALIMCAPLVTGEAET